MSSQENAYTPGSPLLKKEVQLEPEGRPKPDSSRNGIRWTPKLHKKSIRLPKATGLPTVVHRNMGGIPISLERPSGFR